MSSSVFPGPRSARTAAPSAPAEPGAPAGETTPSGTDRPLVRLSGARPGWWLACLALLLGTCLLSLAVGSRTIAVGDTVSALINGRGDDPDSQVIWDLRVPRTLLGVIAGAALAVAGALIQALTRNPLADPGILGVNAGAAFAVVLGTLTAGVMTLAGSVWWALAGAGLTTLAVFLLSLSGRGRTADPATLVLGGMALGAVLQGIATGISLVFPEVFNGMRVWTAGHLSDRPLDTIAPLAPLVLLGLALAFAASGSLNAMAMGDDAARSLGVRVPAVRVTVIVGVTLLCGVATALVGPVGFVGLMIPHVVRWCFGVDQRWIIAFSAVLGGVLLLASDVLGRVVLPQTEVPAGIVTAVLGAPVLIALARRKNASTL